MTAFSASRSVLKAAAAGRCHLSTVAVPKKSQNIIHMDQFMTRADLLLKKKTQQQQQVVAKAATASGAAKRASASVVKPSSAQPPLLRGATDAQITVAN